MSDDIRKLKTISARLNESSDSLTSILTQINDKLNEMNFGLTVWLDIPVLSTKLVQPGHFHIKQHVHSLEEREIVGYAKLKNEWGLAVKNVTMAHGHFEGDENSPFSNPIDGEVRSLLNCSRDLRTRSVELLPDLFNLLKERAEEVIENLDKAKEFVSEL